MAETRRVLRPASFLSFALCSSTEDGELASAIVDKPVALRPNGLPAIAVADDFSQSTVCLRLDEKKAIAQAATLRSLPKYVAAQLSGDRNQGQNESVGGQGKNTGASGQVVDQCDSRINPDALEFRPIHFRQRKLTPGMG